MKHGAHEDHREVVDNELSRINSVTQQILDACIKIHKSFGPGLLESVYETCLAHECTKRGYGVQTQKAIPVAYDGINFDTAFRADMIVDNSVIIEIKAIERVLPIHEAQLLTYMRLSGMRVGFLVNFNVKLMKDGVKRYVL